MIFIPVLPLDASARQVLDFCLEFQTVAGFIAVFEEKWKDLGGGKDQMGQAYEQTEMLHHHFFTRRRFKDREVFYNARSRYNCQG